jgi:serine protease Do
LIPQLVTEGEVTRGYLGVSIQTITPDLAKALKLNGLEGALVSDVVPGGPASKGGILRGDIILDYDGKKIRDSHDLPTMVAATPVNKEVSVTVLRKGKEENRVLKAGKLPSEEAEIEKSAGANRGNWGLGLHDLTPQIAHQLRIKADQGVVVVRVEPGSPADEAGIRQGDVIVEVHRHPVNSVQDVKNTMEKCDNKDPLLLLVQRQDGKFYVPLKQQG